MSRPFSSGRERSNSQAVPAAGDRIDYDALPSLYRDRAFWGMTTTQFLGALNDSIFKQFVLLICVSVIVTQGQRQNLQGEVQLVFAIPFILLSGIAGFWSDRISKRTVIVFCKLAEVAVMAAGMLALWSLAGQLQRVEREDAAAIIVAQGVPWALLVVLALMAAQSAIFGPAKYGILPEMVRGRDLPRFNGMIQMTTFAGLIFGHALGGVFLTRLHDRLWLVGLACVVIAAIGTFAAIFVRRTPVAQPNARFSLTAVVVATETRQMLGGDRTLVRALVVYSIFWFIAALVHPTVNAMGKQQLGLNEERTSFLTAATAVGIAIGCVLAGKLSKGIVRFGLVRVGAWGLLGSLALLSIWPTAAGPPALAASAEAAALWVYFGSQTILGIAGVFVGLLAVPLQVYLQAQPPAAFKGRMIGTMNLINWIGIASAGAFYAAANRLFATADLPESTMFAAAAVVLLPIALLYRPADATLR